jgi:hypothetical protein
MQRYTVYLSGNCSTCFGCYHHPSSGAHTTVSTASGICQTVIVICRYPGRVGTDLSVLWVAYATLILMTGGGTSRNMYSSFQINKLCNVASCWIYIRILLRCTDAWKLNVWWSSRKVHINYCQILIKLEFSRQTFEKYSNNNFTENPLKW